MVSNEDQYFDFIRRLRIDPDNISGFLDQVYISPEQQELYMAKHKSCFHICLCSNEPVGYIGIVDNDIRICTRSDFKNKGVGTFMLTFVRDNFPDATGKILGNNIISKKLFDKVGVPYRII